MRTSKIKHNHHSWWFARFCSWSVWLHYCILCIDWLNVYFEHAVKKKGPTVRKGVSRSQRCCLTNLPPPAWLKINDPIMLLDECLDIVTYQSDVFVIPSLPTTGTNSVWGFNTQPARSIRLFLLCKKPPPHTHTHKHRSCEGFLFVFRNGFSFRAAR